MLLERLCLASLFFPSGCCSLSPAEQYIPTKASLKDNTSEGMYKVRTCSSVALLGRKGWQFAYFPQHHPAQMRSSESHEAIISIAAGLVLLSVYGNGGAWGILHKAAALYLSPNIG